MSTEGSCENATHEGDVEEPIEVGDLLDDPQTDVEALCLCAVLWSPAATARHVVDLLARTDFFRALYGEVFELIREQVSAVAPHDPHRRRGRPRSIRPWRGRPAPTGR